MSYVKWAAIIAVVWLAFKWLTKAYDAGSANLSADGEGITGSGWAAPINVTRYAVRAWAPPYGIPHEGGAA